LAGEPLAQENEVSRRDLSFEYALNALRLKDGFSLRDFAERTGQPLSVIRSPLQKAEQQGLIERDLDRVWATPRGFDFLSDLQSLFLPD